MWKQNVEAGSSKQQAAGSRPLESLDLDDMSLLQVSQEQRSTPQSCLTLGSFETVTLCVCVCDPDLETAEKTLTPNQTTGLLYLKPSEFRHAFRFYLAIFHNKTLQHLAAMSLALQAAIFP